MTENTRTGPGQGPSAASAATKRAKTGSNDSAYTRLLRALHDVRCDVTTTGPNAAQAQCPAHDDDQPSLSVTGIEGQTLVYCHAGCKTADVLRELGLSLADLYDSPGGSRYRYESTDGTPERTVTRTPDKKFSQANAPKGQGTLLFRLTQVVAAVELGLPVFVVEGEKDVLALESLGAVATTAPMGSSNWRKVDASPLFGADVTVVVDQDEAGELWAQQVRASLSDEAASLRFCRAAAGKDAADHIAAGHGLADFVDLKVEPSAVDVTNAARAADWLLSEVGRPGTPLAGLFRRDGGLVHTPRIGEDGYVPLTDHDDDGPAQVRVVDSARLRSLVQFRYALVRSTQKGGPSAATFPQDSALLVAHAVDSAPALRPLAGVTHTPMLRADGSVLATEGYDPASSRLYLPELGMKAPRVPGSPTAAEVRAAHDLIAEMVAGFDFNTDHDRANYLALLFTPLLRVVVAPPYPLGLLHAHQPGSGKSLLAWILRELHGGALRPLPESGAEFRKVITSILSVTTAPVVQFDNVTKLASTQLDALLTTDVWSDRPLGSTADVTSRNDRLWVATGNNVALGGDLMRRVRWVSIDPDDPHPERRTFALDLKPWVRARRGELLGALLTLLRAWVVAGRPLGPEAGSDDFAVWTRTVQGVLRVAGWTGTVGHQDTVQQEGSDEDNEWGAFLAELHRLFGEESWTAKELVDRYELDRDAVPADMNVDSARAVGAWLRNRVGRWAGGFSVRSRHDAIRNVTVWKVRSS